MPQSHRENIKSCNFTVVCTRRKLNSLSSSSICVYSIQHSHRCTAGRLTWPRVIEIIMKCNKMHAGCTFCTSSQNNISWCVRYTWRRWTRPEDESFSTASEKLICWWTEEDRGSAGQLSFSLCYCVAAESVHFSGMPNHLRLKLRSLPDTVIVPPGVWCRWPKTLSLFHHCTHSISELPTKKK